MGPAHLPPHVACAFAQAAFRALVNKKDEESLTPLHWAVMCDHGPHVERLLAAGPALVVVAADGGAGVCVACWMRKLHL